MTVYRKKPEYVEAWQVRVGHPVPDWLWAEIKRGSVSMPQEGAIWWFFGVGVACGDGNNRIAKGLDWIVKTPTGLQVVTDDDFARDYETAPPSVKAGDQVRDASTLANEAEYDGVQDAANNAAKPESPDWGDVIAEMFAAEATDDEPDLDERRRMAAMHLAVAIGDLHTGASAVARAKEIEAYLRGDE